MTTDVARSGDVRVLHGLVSPGGALHLWAETFPPTGRRRGAHPFALDAALLPVGERRGPAVLLLPSTSAGPLPSPQLGLPPRRPGRSVPSIRIRTGKPYAPVPPCPVPPRATARPFSSARAAE